MFQRKDGFVSIPYLILMSVLLPVALFFMFELKEGFMSKDHMQNTIENATDAALWQVNHELLAKGQIEIDVDQAYPIAGRVLESGWVSELSLDTPEYTVHVENDIEQLFIESSLSGTQYEVKHPTVFIQSEYASKGIFFSKFDSVKNETASYISWIENKADVEIPEAEESADNIKIVTDSVVNPRNYPEMEGFPLAEARHLKVLGHSEIKLSFAGDFAVQAGVIRVYADGSPTPITTEDITSEGVTLYIPEDVPNGSVLALEVDAVFQGDDGGMRPYTKRVEGYGEIVGKTPELLGVTKSHVVR